MQHHKIIDQLLSGVSISVCVVENLNIGNGTFKMEILILALLTAIGAYIIMWKINLALFAKFDWQVDVTLSGALLMLFAGSFAGAATAVLAGIFISLFLFITKVVLRV